MKDQSFSIVYTNLITNMSIARYRIFLLNFQHSIKKYWLWGNEMGQKLMLVLPLGFGA